MCSVMFFLLGLLVIYFFSFNFFDLFEKFETIGLMVVLFCLLDFYLNVKSFFLKKTVLNHCNSS